MLAWFSTWQICKVADGVRIVYSGEHTGVINTLLIGLNSSNRVIIVADANRFERVEDRKRASVIGALLTGLDMAEPLGSWRSIKNVGIAC